MPLDTATNPWGQRPTATEHAAAKQSLARLMDCNVIRESSDKNEPAVVACAMALHRGEAFVSDREAKRTFGVAPSTDVRRRWLPRLMLLDKIDAGGRTSADIERVHWPSSELPSLDELRRKVTNGLQWKCQHRPACTSKAEHAAKITSNEAQRRQRARQASKQAQASIKVQKDEAMVVVHEEPVPALRLSLHLHNSIDHPRRNPSDPLVFSMLQFRSGKYYHQTVNQPERTVERCPPKRKRGESEVSLAARRKVWQQALDVQRQAEGQCEGTTHEGRRCHVTAACKHADSEPLRQGGRFCRHHMLHDKPPVYCAATRRRGKRFMRVAGKYQLVAQPCLVHDQRSFADADPLRRGASWQPLLPPSSPAVRGVGASG